MTEVLTEQAWLLQNKINPFPVGGTLRLEEGTITFVLSTIASHAVLGWVEKRAGLENLGDRLKAGEAIELFRFSKGEFVVNWPKMYAGSACEITGPQGTPWVIALDYPSGGSISQTISLFTGRKKGKLWKAALAA